MNKEIQTTESYAQFFKCLSEPVRLRILFLLLKRGELCVCDLVDTLDISQSVVSRHLAYLRNNGVLSSRRDGAWVYYTLADNSPFFSAVLHTLTEFGESSMELSNDIGRLSEPSSGCC
ncbi:ArsR/SmtB family transcription factor [Alkalimarinus sediminis]|uniref:Metalloregulator ArsR/SmtB family transcription factor n=1 Tax=Alkalimarinus sediminis TaxID=1632866 RepID=A0A9E8KQ79_9ALTE|nr:metalloregulator ArsR/SmtB family transcription factor [Alkalimarinus sediminis]UZW74915.1 metalloregulator ArsR/SmtB family transcription factor [Alkalimarinus sediminis]